MFNRQLRERRAERGCERRAPQGRGCNVRVVVEDALARGRSELGTVRCAEPNLLVGRIMGRQFSGHPRHLVHNLLEGLKSRSGDDNGGMPSAGFFRYT